MTKVHTDGRGPGAIRCENGDAAATVSAFHLTPWLKRISRRRSGVGS